MWNIPPGVLWPCLTEECPDTVCTTFKHCFKATAVNFRYIYACFSCSPLPFPVKMSHCARVCVYTCICVCARVCGELSHCTRSEPLVASLWWDPDGNLQWTAHSSNHYGSTNLLFFISVHVSLKYFLRSDGRTQTTALLQSCRSYHFSEQGGVFTCHWTSLCLVFDYHSVISALPAVCHILPPSESLTSRGDGILFFFCQSYP